MSSGAAPPTTTTVTAFDGSYLTTIRSTGSTTAAQGTSWCVSPGQPTITVTNGQFSYAVPHPNVPGDATPVYQAVFAEDGTFVGQLTAGRISGLVKDNHIEGRIDGSACLYAFSGDRV